MSFPVRCLIVEDLDDDAQLLIRHLKGRGFSPTYRRVDTMETLDAALREGGWDVVLCDYQLPELDALRVLRSLADRGIVIPFIVVSGSMSEEQLVGLMKAGAHDIVLKDNLTRLCAVIEREIADVRRREAVQRENEKIVSHIVHHDPLTGLPNRTLFQDRLRQAILESRRRGDLGAVLYLDLDHFKDVNDTLGHPVGDDLLRVVANRLSECARESDSVARLGGDEFALVATNLEDIHGVVHLAERVLNCLNQPILTPDHRVDSSTSIGITVFPNDGCDATSLLKNADLALYSAKALGRGNFQFYDARMTAEVEERKAVEIDMAEGLKEGAFFLEYQPQIDSQSGRAVGAEALVRWRRPGCGLMPPDRFIPTAERTGLIVPLGARVIEIACSAFRSWQDQGLPFERIAVNVSVAQLRAPGFVSFVRQTLESNGLGGPSLEIEITESMMLHHVERVGPALRELHELGIKVAIDDFGTGYSSLTYLKGFPVDRLKIDRSFVDGVTTDADDRAIARSVIGLAKALNLQVIAEGVETAGQMEWLRRHGCDEAQGYRIGRPVSDAAIAVWARQWDAGCVSAACA